VLATAPLIKVSSLLAIHTLRTDGALTTSLPVCMVTLPGLRMAMLSQVITLILMTTLSPKTTLTPMTALTLMTILSLTIIPNPTTTLTTIPLLMTILLLTTALTLMTTATPTTAPTQTTILTLMIVPMTTLIQLLFLPWSVLVMVPGPDTIGMMHPPESRSLTVVLMLQLMTCRESSTLPVLIKTPRPLI